MYQKSLIGEKQDKGGRLSEPSDNRPQFLHFLCITMSTEKLAISNLSR